MRWWGVCVIVFPTAHTSHSLFIGGFADQGLAFLGHECSYQCLQTLSQNHAVDTPSHQTYTGTQLTHWWMLSWLAYQSRLGCIDNAELGYWWCLAQCNSSPTGLRYSSGRQVHHSAALTSTRVEGIIDLPMSNPTPHYWGSYQRPLDLKEPWFCRFKF